MLSPLKQLSQYDYTICHIFLAQTVWDLFFQNVPVLGPFLSICSLLFRSNADKDVSVLEDQPRKKLQSHLEPFPDTALTQQVCSPH